MADASVLPTAVLNLVKAVQNIAQTYLNVQGALNAPQISATTLVSSVPGRVASVSVTTAGTGTGTIYDCTSTATLLRPIAIIPEAVGVYMINLPSSYGIVVAPGTSQVVTVSYS